MTTKLDRYLSEVMQANNFSCGYSFEGERDSEVSMYLRIRKNYFGQDLFTFLRETHLNTFLGENWNLVVPVAPSFLRSVTVSRLDQRYSIGRRLNLSDNLFDVEERRHRERRVPDSKDVQPLKNYLKCSRTLTELCAYNYELSDLPKCLKSLCCSWQKENLHRLPMNLRSLRIVVNRSD